MSPDPDNPKLSDRQREILKLVAVGYSDKEVASVLSISISTVRFYMRDLRALFGVHGRGGLVYRYAKWCGVDLKELSPLVSIPAPIVAAK